jgi:hypothetical protein
MGQMMMPMLALAAVFAAASCAGGAAGSPEPEWQLQGVIAAVDAGTQGARVTVELDGGTTAEPRRAVLLVSPETVVEVQRPDGSTGRGNAGDLAAGARVRARHTGVEMRSLPPQYVATQLRIVPAS